MSGIECTEIGPRCTLEQTIYGYYPSLPANAFFLAFFALAGVTNLVLGIRYKTWTYVTAMGLGCLAEVMGYLGRILLHSNPFSTAGFEMQICCLTLAPAFNSAAIYLTLKHLVKCFGRETSRIRPKFYTWGFICADILALIFQGSGGGIAATAETESRRDIGDSLMLTGICFQVVTLACFGALAVDYIIRRRASPEPLSEDAAITKSQLKFRLFLSGLVIAYVTILVRCIYRIPELSGGWQNPIMQDENLFIALESCMILIATLCQTMFHPGFCFPRLAAPLNGQGRKSQKGEKSDNVIKNSSEEEV